MVIPIRKDTESSRKRTRPVNYERQNMVAILGIKGEGKSYLAESLAIQEFEMGYNFIDLHAPILGNMESAFWCIPRLGEIEIEENGKKRKVIDQALLEKEIIQFKKNPLPYINSRPCYKITLFASESIMFDQSALDRYNGRIYSQDEWYAKNPTKIIKETFGCVSIYNQVPIHYDMFNPPKKPQKEWGKEMIRVVKLPFVNTKDDSESNIKAKKIIFDELLLARIERRIVVYNRNMFANEKQYFWTQELQIRSLKDFYKLHCRKQFPSEHGYTESNFPKHLRYWHKMVILTRELAELAPAKFKADRSGESTSVKRALVELARICRHTQIDWFSDFQRYGDCDGQVRTQFDDIFFKKYNEDLAGDKSNIFDRINEEREKNLNTYPVKKAKMINSSYYPDLHRLSKNYFYGFYDSHDIKLFPVISTKHCLKEPYMEFHEMTGVLFYHDEKKIPTQARGSSRTVNKTIQQAFFSTVDAMKQKKMKWAKIKEELVKLQKSGKLEYPQDLSTKSNDWINATYSKLKKKAIENTA
jgi:hypothetical protein